jgi:uncharacterized RDD family membrane protein YckC
MADDQIFVRSVTGVDLTITLAGPGSRSYAFVIDWHIRLLLSLAWLLLTTAVAGLGVRVGSHDALLTALPASIIYFLYHPILEITMRGRTPGKRMAGVRLLDRNGGAPSTMALFIRNMFRLVDSLPLAYVIGLISCFVTAHRVRIGDMAAGTLLVLDQSESEKTLVRMEALAGQSSLPLESLELVDQVLERWDSLEPEHRRHIAASLLARVTDSSAVNLNEDQMRARLQALLRGADPTPHV